MGADEKPRATVVVDVETNGLDVDVHRAVEVAWWNLDTDERGRFVPMHDVSEVLRRASIRALQVNRYIDRLADAEQDTSGVEVRRLHDQLNNATLTGSNPRFDAPMLSKLFRNHPTGKVEPWHYRLRDIGAYAEAVLDLDHVPGLWEICTLLGIEPGDHSAEADVTATGLALRELRERAKWLHGIKRAARYWSQDPGPGPERTLRNALNGGA